VFPLPWAVRSGNLKPTFADMPYFPRIGSRAAHNFVVRAPVRQAAVLQDTEKTCCIIMGLMWLISGVNMDSTFGSAANLCQRRLLIQLGKFSA
jgi:hypothetical protein